MGNEALARLIAANQLEQLDDNLFRSSSTWGSTNRIYGGEVMSQSLSAAQQTVAEGLVLHSMHAYFMRPGDVSRPVIYDVESLRDGRSFVSRRITARQHGHAIYSCQASFQVVEPGLDHHSEMPPVPGPEGLESDAERRGRQPHPRPMAWPIEYRQVTPMEENVTAAPPCNHIWMRAAGALPDGLALHQQLLAFASDAHLLFTTLRPHGVSRFARDMQIATVDHSLWFHRPFRMDEWLLYELYSPSASNARGLALGRIYRADGVLVASSAQEGLIRRWESPQPVP